MASLPDPRSKTIYINNEKVNNIKAGAVQAYKLLLPEQQAGTTGTSSALPRARAAAEVAEVLCPKINK